MDFGLSNSGPFYGFRCSGCLNAGIFRAPEPSLPSPLVFFWSRKAPVRGGKQILHLNSGNSPGSPFLSGIPSCTRGTDPGVQPTSLNVLSDSAAPWRSMRVKRDELGIFLDSLAIIKPLAKEERWEAIQRHLCHVLFHSSRGIAPRTAVTTHTQALDPGSAGNS